MENTDDFAIDFAALLAGPAIIVVAVWLISAFTAEIIAESRGRSSLAFFFATFFFLGPLGPGFALVAPREYQGRPVPPARAPSDIRPVMEGRRRFTCPRCGAANDILQADTSYDCWQCAEHRTVRPV